MDYKDYYKILEIDIKATAAEVKRAYRTLAKKNHPDKNLGNKKAEEQFKLVNEANEVLGNPEKRKKYDELGENWQQNQYTQKQNQQYRQSNPNFDGNNQDNFSDFFEQFFSQQRNRNQYQASKGSDYQTEIEISLEEAYKGTSRTIQLENQKIRITTKPGTHDNQLLRIKNKGAKGSSETNNGDLFVKIRVSENTNYIRKGNDLYHTETINLYDAILGNDLIITTLSGKLKTKIPKGIQNGKNIRLKGKGMPIYEKEGTFGDLYIVFQIQIPENLNEKQKALFEELKAIS